MPLHDNLEKKRRQNISQLKASGGCHICGSTCRTSHLNSLNGGIDNGVNDGNAFSSRFVDADESGEHEREHDAATANGSIVNNNSNNNPKNNNNNPSPTPMKTCSCFGIPPSDPNYWPYSLRVCTFCILDDVATGRIRCCGICGVVACDENCGAELVECTDSEEWNNAGEFI